MTDQEKQDMRKFRSRLRILKSIVSDELPDDWPQVAKSAFIMNPLSFFLWCSDSMADDLWWVLLKREGGFV